MIHVVSFLVLSMELGRPVFHPVPQERVTKCSQRSRADYAIRERARADGGADQRPFVAGNAAIDQRLNASISARTHQHLSGHSRAENGMVYVAAVVRQRRY